MSGKFVLGECKRRDGKLAWIVAIGDDGEITAIHHSRMLGVVAWSHDCDGTSDDRQQDSDLLPNAPDLLKEARARLRAFMATQNETHFSLQTWRAFELLAQEPDE